MSLRGVVAGLQLGGQLGIGAVGEGGDALACAVVGVAVVGAGNESFELVVALAAADAPRQVGATVGASVVQGHHLVILIAEEDHLVTTDTHGDRLALNVLLLDAGVPVLAVAHLGHVVMHSDARRAPRRVLIYTVRLMGPI